MSDPVTKFEIRRKLRVAINDLLKPFDMYGMGVYILPANVELIKLAEEFHKDMSSLDKEEG